MFSGLALLGFRSPNHCADDVERHRVERAAVVFEGFARSGGSVFAEFAVEAALCELLAVALFLPEPFVSLGFGASSSGVVTVVARVDSRGDFRRGGADLAQLGEPRLGVAG
jgi:hypothetical protein